MAAQLNTGGETSSTASVLASDSQVRVAQTALLKITADFHDQATLPRSLMAVAESIQRIFNCSRVIIGLGQRERSVSSDAAWASIAAISQQAVIDRRSAECQLLAAVVTESCLHAQQVLLPGNEASRYEKHAQLLIGRSELGLVTTPLVAQQKLIGALVMEQPLNSPLSSEQLALVQQIAHVLAPMIVDRQRAERTPLGLVSDTFRQALSWLKTPEKLAAKAMVAGLFVGFLLICLVPVNHRVSATAELVPLQLRTIASPVDGYVELIETSVGERVQAGQVLLRLDTRELVLEQQYWRGEQERIAAELRAVRAAGDRKQVMILNAEVAQAKSQLALMDQRVNRSTITAPHDGLVVSGELAKQLGAPVKRGQSLIELVPGSAFTVNLLVEEYDISLIKQGQSGELALQANPQEKLAFKVTKIHPIAMAHKGQNRFRVEAELSDKPVALLPGQTGVGKVEVGSAALVHIAFKRFAQWSRLKFWEWFG